MKLIIQVPCFNEQHTLPVTLAALPRTLPGVSQVEWLVVDDGSTDDTAAVARAHGADHVVVLAQHLGLAAAFKAGLEACLVRGADIIVNTDADNQYHAGDLPALIEPILRGRADLVVGTRPLRSIPHFSPAKRWLQIWGSWAVRRLSGTQVPDARSGYRAFSRRLAASLDVFSRYTYTLETLIQAGHEGFIVDNVPVRVNADLRPSRLIRNIPSDLIRSAHTLITAYFRYCPIRAFGILGTGAVLTGAVLRSPGFAAGGLAACFSLGYLSHLLEQNRRLLRELKPRTRFVEEVSAAGPARLRLVTQP